MLSGYVWASVSVEEMNNPVTCGFVSGLGRFGDLTLNRKYWESGSGCHAADLRVVCRIRTAGKLMNVCGRSSHHLLIFLSPLNRTRPVSVGIPREALEQYWHSDDGRACEKIGNSCGVETVLVFGGARLGEFEGVFSPQSPRGNDGCTARPTARRATCRQVPPREPTQGSGLRRSSGEVAADVRCRCPGQGQVLSPARPTAGIESCGSDRIGSARGALLVHPSTVTPRHRVSAIDWSM